MTNRLLDLPDRHVFGDRALRQLLLKGAIGGPEQSPGVTHPQRSVLQVALNRGWELEQPQGVRDGRPASPDAKGDVVVRQREVLDQLLVGRRLFEGIELLALNVLDDR